MFPSQTNTLPGTGTRVYNSGEDLSGDGTVANSKEGRLVKIVDGGSTADAKLPETVYDLCLFVLVDGGASGADSQVLPLTPGEERRVRANGTGSCGAILVLEAISGANIGKVRTVPTTEGVYFSPGVAAEDWVDEQLVKINPLPRLVVVGTPFTSATPAATAATNSTPYGFSQAQADAILTNVREMRAFMVANNWKATS